MPELRTPILAAGALGARAQPTIEGRGLVLRPWQAGDAATLARAYADPEIQRWHVRTMDGDEALAWVLERREMWRAERGGDWAVLAGGTPAGRVALRKLELGDGCGEVGYWVLPEARGSGIAALALGVLGEWLFEQAGLRRLELEHSTANPASCRVALKAGFVAEGMRRSAVLHADGWHDMHVHARLAGDARPGVRAS
ncbi:MAG: GNAT family N-acetyltransferase [Solirubrobacteraceae bacterium]